MFHTPGKNQDLTTLLFILYRVCTTNNVIFVNKWFTKKTQEPFGQDRLLRWITLYCGPQCYLQLKLSLIPELKSDRTLHEFDFRIVLNFTP